MVVAAADAQQPEQGPYRSGTSSDQPAGMGRLAWAAGTGRDLLAGQLITPAMAASPIVAAQACAARSIASSTPACPSVVSRPATVRTRARVSAAARSATRSANARQGIGRPTAEPPFSPPGAGRPREVPGGPTRALHNASLTST